MKVVRKPNAKVMWRKNGVIAKVLNRILWHPAWSEGYPIRVRMTTLASIPTIRFNGARLDVWLPCDLGQCIPVLAKLIRQLRNGKHRSPSKPRQKPKAQSLHVDPLFPEDDQSLLKPATLPTNGHKPKSAPQQPCAKPTNGNAPQPQPKPRQPTNKPQRKENTLPPMVSVACQRCGHVVSLPPEWLGLARCFICGSLFTLETP